MTVIECEIQWMLEGKKGAEELVKKDGYTLLTEIIDRVDNGPFKDDFPGEVRDDIPWTSLDIHLLTAVVCEHPRKSCELVQKRIDQIQHDMGRESTPEKQGLER